MRDFFFWSGLVWWAVLLGAGLWCLAVEILRRFSKGRVAKIENIAPEGVRLMPNLKVAARWQRELQRNQRRALK